jgi:D-lactate dehydrogenase (cytochrome)
VLAGGDVLDLARGECRAALGAFEIETCDGRVARVPVPDYVMPQVAKRSAGYHAEPEMDLVDLFVGSEGTLGVVTRVVLGVVADRPRFWGWIGFRREAEALAFTARLRQAAHATWASGDPNGIDIAAVESVDGRCLALLREAGADRAHGVALAPHDEAALLFEAELPPGTDRSRAQADLASSGDEAAADAPLLRLAHLLRDAGVADRLELALPGDTRRARDLQALREAVPQAVNHRIAETQRTRDAGVRKVAADMIVPFERLPEAMAAYRESFARRGLDHALWGHVSDGNIHANAIPQTSQDVALGDEAILECGARVIAMGGCPLAEHGVGRNATKMALLRLLYGDDGIAAMRRVRTALDPDGTLAPGVLFAP